MSIRHIKKTTVFAVAIAIPTALSPLASGADEIAISAADRAALSLTIYGNGRAQVRDRRIVPLPTGVATVAFEDVSRAMDPTSVIIDGPVGLSVLQQSFQRQVISQDPLLRHAIGKTVRVVRNHPTTGADVIEEATLLGVDGGVVLRIGDRIETGAPGRIVFDAVPEGLRVRPTLLADVRSPAAGPTPLTLSYLTDGLAWQADYAVIVTEVGGPNLDVVGRATISNNSGTDYRNTAMLLVAGDPRRVSSPVPPGPMVRALKSEAAGMVMAQDMSPEALGDLHFYTVPGIVNLDDQETKQVGLLSASGVPAKRRYISLGHVSPGVRSIPPADTHPQVRLGFDNVATAGLGVPLPGGTARVYERDSEGQPRFVGEARLAHTPDGGDVELTLSEAFDITIKRTQTDYAAEGRPISAYDSRWRVELDNAKDQPVVVEIVETITGAWEIISESLPHVREDAGHAAWKVTVPAKGTAFLAYRVTARLER